MSRFDRFLFAASALAIGLYFFFLVRPSLHVWFTPDDTMNLYRSCTGALGELVKASFLFFLSSPFLRPMAAAWYRTIFYFAGLNAAPFHIANLLILAFNGFLTYAIVRWLAGSREIGAVAALIGCYTTRLACLYFDTGYIFDVLCYAFYFGAFLLYVRARQQKRMLKPWEMAACCLLYICALNSKEMAVTLPLFLGLYELLYHPPQSLRAGEFGPEFWPESWRWVAHEGRGALIAGALTVIFAWGRSSGGDSILRDPGYLPLFTWARWIETSRHFFSDLTDSSDQWQAWAVLLVWAATLAVAWLSRSRALRFAWLFLMLSPLPVAFIPPRGASQYYVPWFGWVLFLSIALVKPLELATRRIWGDPWWLSRARGAVLVAGLILILFPYYQHRGWSNVFSASREAPRYKAVVEQLHRLEPRLRPNSHLLFLNDPTNRDSYDLLFLVQLSYGDRTLDVKRVKQLPPDATAFDYIFDYQNGDFVELKRPAGS